MIIEKNIIKLKKKIVSISLCIALVAGMMPSVVYETRAEETKIDYVAFGDSISTGYGLKSAGTEGFANIIANETGATLTNASKNGNTATGILEQLSTGNYDDKIADAELITITCGGNDLMAVLYQLIADAYNESNNTSVSANSVKSSWSNGGIIFLPYVKNAIDNFATSTKTAEALDSYATTMFGANGVMEYIRSKNSTAVVIMATQYNPYISFSGGTLNDIYAGMETGAVALNSVITNYASTGKYIIADVYGAFGKATENLSNAFFNSITDYDMDFHPNAAGHKVIAQTIMTEWSHANLNETTSESEKIKAPAKASIKKIYKRKKSAKKLRLTLKKITGADGYQVSVYKTKKNAKSNKKALIKKLTKKAKVTIKSKKLKGKKTLYVRARAYALDANKEKNYGKWSIIKKTK